MRPLAGSVPGVARSRPSRHARARETLSLPRPEAHFLNHGRRSKRVFECENRQQSRKGKFQSRGNRLALTPLPESKLADGQRTSSSFAHKSRCGRSGHPGQTGKAGAPFSPAPGTTPLVAWLLIVLAPPHFFLDPRVFHDFAEPLDRIVDRLVIPQTQLDHKLLLLRLENEAKSTCQPLNRPSHDLRHQSGERRKAMRQETI